MAGEGDAERLVVLLEARIRDFERNMAKASGTAGKTYGAMRRDSTTATDRMETDMVRSTNSINRALAATSTKIGGFGKAMVAGFAGGLIAGGLAGIINQIGQVASAVASVGDEARRAGVDVKTFQEWGVVARDNRIPIDAMVDAFKELSIRADEFAMTGGGSAAEAFARLGMTPDEVQERLQNPSDLMLEIIERTQALGDTAAGIRIFDEVLGGTGAEQFTNLMGQSREQIEATIQRGHELGLVMDEQLIAKAAEVDRKFNEIAATISSGVRVALVDMIYPILDFIKAQERAIQNNRLMAMDADAQRQLQEYTQTLEALTSAAGREFPAIEASLQRVVEKFLSAETGADNAKQALIEMARDPDMSPVIGEIMGLISAIGEVTGRARDAKLELASLNSDPIGGPLPSFEDFSSSFGAEEAEMKPRPRAGASAGPSLAGGGGGGGVSKIQQQRQAVEEMIASLEAEREAIVMSADEQERFAAIRQAGAAATEEQKARITELIQAVTEERAAAELLVGDENPFELLQQQMAGLESLLERGAISWEQYGQAAQRAHMLAASTTLGAVGQITGALGQIFEGNKAFAVANAVVNTAQGITAALALPPPMGWIQAAAVAASGAAQISTIMSTQKGSTSKPNVGGKGGGASSGSGSTASEPAQRATVINLTLSGAGRYSRDDIRDLFDQMTDSLKDGVGANFKVAVAGG